MHASEVAESLNLKRSGKRWRGPCPVHGGSGDAFQVSESDRENPLVHCFAGCEFRDIVRELKDRGLWVDSEPRRTPSQRRQSKRKAEIRKANRILEDFDKVYANDSTPMLDSDWKKRDWAIATLRRHGEC